MRLGSDPEVFLVNPQGKHIAINGYINHGKYNPLQIEGLPSGFTLQEDNVALEYGIPPCKTADEFVEAIQQVMEESRKWLPTDLDFSKLSCTLFEDDQLRHPLALKFGCEPDYCAYTDKVNPSPNPPDWRMRSAGGHIHVETDQKPSAVGMAMDLCLAVPAVLMDDGIERKQMYGKAGAIRYKPYGLEYRTLSNFWIFSPETIRWAWHQTERAVHLVKEGLLPSKSVLSRVRRCINTNDKDMAFRLIDKYNLEVV
jgi:hypothetical protein